MCSVFDESMVGGTVATISNSTARKSQCFPSHAFPRLDREDGGAEVRSWSNTSAFCIDRRHCIAPNTDKKSGYQELGKASPSSVESAHSMDRICSAVSFFPSQVI